MTAYPEDFWGEPIHTYTRAQALAEGVLVDVSPTAREAGFGIAVALTANVWADVQEIPAAQKTTQDPEGRLWDLLFVGRLAAGRNLRTDAVVYRLRMDHLAGNRPSRIYEVKLHVGPGDHGEPVLTIMRPNED